MYKITVDGKTMVGCNEDAWRNQSRIWFKNGTDDKSYGACFTGSRRVAPNRYAPQSGMNVAGLTFSRLASYFPRQEKTTTKKKIKNEVDFLTDILHTCATVMDVKNYFEQYDHSIFIDDVFIYIDSTGDYIVVEPYRIMEGNDPTYVLSNFCPSITDNAQARKLVRYRNGEDFLKLHTAEPTIAYCTALSDTMHVCRNRNGDGTLLTSIWDIKNGLVNLYFYHDFSSTVQFNIAEELEKGDQNLNIVSLFPANKEFNRLKSYRTPFNTPILRVGLAIIGGILPLISVLFFVVFIRNRKSSFSQNVFLILCLINMLLSYYFFILATNINIYYFDAPYEHPNSELINIFSYFPFVLLIALIPLAVLSFRYIINKHGKTWLKVLLAVNNLVYIVSIIGFAYWGFYHVINYNV